MGVLHDKSTIICVTMQGKQELYCISIRRPGSENVKIFSYETRVDELGTAGWHFSTLGVLNCVYARFSLFIGFSREGQCHESIGAGS